MAVAKWSVKPNDLLDPSPHQRPRDPPLDGADEPRPEIRRGDDPVERADPPRALDVVHAVELLRDLADLLRAYQREDVREPRARRGPAGLRRLLRLLDACVLARARLDLAREHDRRRGRPADDRRARP